MSNSFFDVVLPIFRNKKTWIPLYFILFFYFIYKISKRTYLVVPLALSAIGLADGISSHIIKPLVARIRPCNLVEFSAEINTRIHCGSGFSFPSSHATNHFALATFIGLALYKDNPWFLRIGLVWAGIISIAQVYVGVHFPVDIFVGMLLGLTIGVFLKKILDLLMKYFKTKGIVF